MKRLQLLTLLFYVIMAANAAGISYITKVNKVEKTDRGVVLSVDGDAKVKISVEQDDIIRIQVTPNGTFVPSLSIKFGFVKDDFPTPNFKFHEDGNTLSVSTRKMGLRITKNPFSITLIDANNNILTQLSLPQSISLSSNGNVLKFNMAANEHFYGFGFMRETFDARGKKLVWKRVFRWKGATVPFFISTRSYGFYSNNTWNHEFDFMAKDQYLVRSTGGELDFYLFSGNDFKQIINAYTDLTGKSWMVPKWAMGIQYRCRHWETQEGALAIAKTFREKDIPLDNIAFEPGWEETFYGNTWKWHPARFPDPKKMFTEFNKLGIHVDLWESGTAPVNDITNPEIRKKWYEPRYPLLDLGVEMFKQDDPYPRSIESTGYDDPVYNNLKVAGTGYDSNELSNIANSLYTETSFNEYRSRTGKRAITEFCAYNASVASHRWPFVWASDFLAGNGMLNAGLSGHAMTSEDLRDYSPRGIHRGYLTPYPVLDSWAYYKEPWLFSDKVERFHRFYSRFRQKLVPYLYSALWQAHTLSIPMMRPMILEYPKDTSTYQMTNEFMLGDWFLVVSENAKIDESRTGSVTEAVRSSGVYLPQGEWINYWTGKVFKESAGHTETVDWPSYAGGALLVKAGAIIPVGRVNNFVDETPYNVINLEIYPFKKSTCSLYEDSGNGYDYEKGLFSTTRFECDATNNSVNFKSYSPEGLFKSLPKNRVFLLKIFSEIPPGEVRNRNEKLQEFKNINSLIYCNVKGWCYDEASKRIFVKTENRWKLKSNQRIERNEAISLELDDVQFEGTAAIEESPLDVNVSFDIKHVKQKQPISGTATSIELTPEQQLLSADGISSSKVNVQIGDKNGILSTTRLNSAFCEIITRKGQLKLTINPPEMNEEASWIGTKVTAFVKFSVDGKTLNFIENRPVTLKVFSKERVLLKEYAGKSINGEVEFNGVDYYKIPAKCYFIASSPGYEDVEIKVYESDFEIIYK